MYATQNFKTKKELKEAVARGEAVTYFQPGGMFHTEGPPLNGKITLEGPHYPKPHKWYAACVAKDGLIVKVT